MPNPYSKSSISPKQAEVIAELHRKSPYSTRPKFYREPVGMAHIPPRKRPDMSPREYQARIDRLKVQDGLRARMTVTEIARKLGKDKAWVCRTIQRLEKERETVYSSPKAEEQIEENIGQLDSLLGRAYAVLNREMTAKGQIAAIRTVADVLRQKTEYQFAIGHVQRRDRAGKGEGESQAESLTDYVNEHLPLSAVKAIIDKQWELDQKRAQEAKRKEEQQRKQARAA